MFSYAASVFDSGFYFNPTLLSLAMALAAGFFEETIFRGVTIPLGIIFTVAVFVISGIWSLYLIRPAMRDKIQTLWNEKWGIE